MGESVESVAWYWPTRLGAVAAAIADTSSAAEYSTGLPVVTDVTVYSKLLDRIWQKIRGSSWEDSTADANMMEVLAAHCLEEDTPGMGVIQVATGLPGSTRYSNCPGSTPGSATTIEIVDRQILLHAAAAAAVGKRLRDNADRKAARDEAVAHPASSRRPGSRRLQRSTVPCSQLVATHSLRTTHYSSPDRSLHNLTTWLFPGGCLVPLFART